MGETILRKERVETVGSMGTGAILDDYAGEVKRENAGEVVLGPVGCNDAGGMKAGKCALRMALGA